MRAPYMIIISNTTLFYSRWEYLSGLNTLGHPLFKFEGIIVPAFANNCHIRFRDFYIDINDKMIK